MDTEQLKILVVEDDIVDQQHLGRAIAATGFNTHISYASDLDEGLAYVRDEAFDCIFVDFNLPGEDGLVFLRDYKAELNNCPVIVVTSHGDENLAVEAMKLGACDYIPKNQISPDGIRQSLGYVVRINEAQRSSSQVKAALRESEKKLEAVIAQSPIIMFAVNSEKKITLLKGKGTENLNLDTEKIIGKTVEEVTKKIPVINTFFNKVPNGREITTSIEFSERHFELTIIPDDKNDSESGFIGIATDITDHKINEQELTNHLNVARETQKVKEQFLANMSHEIRTPIHGIMSLTNLLLKTELTGDQSTYLNAVKKSADNLLVIINDILDLSKLEADKMTFESMIFSLDEILATTVELFRPKAQEKNLSLSNDTEEPLPEFIKGDPTRLSQIINNLVNNAIKFTSEGSVSLSASVVDSNEKCSMIRFSVTDTGIGISNEQINHIFDMFSQAGDDITRKFGGTGLGLSIVKKLVELQGGMINVDSELGNGTTFTFSIPFDIPELYEIEETAENDTVTPEHNSEIKLRILIVEDNDINRLVINKLMKDWDFELSNAVNGREAIRMISANDYDLILLDIEMPEMNGYECIREIRTNLSESKRSIPVMAMTAHANKEEREKCINIGMNDYISKPFDPESLKSKILQLAGDEDDTVKGADKEIAQDNISEARLTQLDYIRELSEDNESFFRDFITLFLTNTPETLDELTSSLDKKDWEGVRQAAHKMKPSLNYLGMKVLREVVVNIEEYAKNKTNLDKIPSLVDTVKTTCESAFKELEEELKIDQTTD